MFGKKKTVSREEAVRDSFAFCAGYQEIMNGGGCY